MKAKDAAEKVVALITKQFPMPESDGDMEAALFIFRDGSEDVLLVPVGDFLSTPVGKDGLAALIGVVMRNANVRYVIYASEAWMIKVPSDQQLPETHIPEGGLENHPDREEAFFVEVYGREECLSINIPIFRKDGVRSLGNPEFIDGKMGGRFAPANIVPPPQGTVH